MRIDFRLEFKALKQFNNEYVDVYLKYDKLVN